MVEEGMCFFGKLFSQKIWEVNPLECLRCHAEMKIISFINERQMIEKILRHLSFMGRGKRGCMVKPGATRERLVSKPFHEDWPEYEEPYITVQWS